MENPRHWRLREQRYRLVGEICPHCGEKIFPPRDVCTGCGGTTVNPPETQNLKNGEIINITAVSDRDPKNGRTVGIPFAIVKLDSGKEVAAQLKVGSHNLPPLGSEVKITSRQLNSENPPERVLEAKPIFSPTQ